MPDGELQFNKRPQEKLKQRRLLLTGSEASTQHALRGHLGSSQQGIDREREIGPGTQPLLGFVGGVLCGSQT